MKLWNKLKIWKRLDMEKEKVDWDGNVSKNME